MSISPLILIAGALVGLVGLIVYMMGVSKKWGMLVPYAGLFLFASLAMPLDWNDRVNPTFWLPVQSNRSNLYFACGIAGSLMLLMQMGRMRGKTLAFSAGLLYLIGVYAALLRFVHVGPGDGVQSVLFSLVTLTPLITCAALVIRDFDDLKTLLRVIGFVNIAWIGMVMVQVVVNPKYITMGNEFRFVGVLSNPQHSGVLMAFFTVVVLWLMLNDLPKYRLIFLALLGVDGLLLLWTGSRTGMGMAAIGLSAVLYSRAGRAILLLPVVAIVGYISLKIVIDVLGMNIGFERLGSTENTRDYAWWKLYTVAMENPMIGVGTEDAEKSENSWLYGFASYGIGMLALQLTFTFVATFEILKSIRTRFSLPPEFRPHLDVLNGIMLMYFAGAVLEGYMVSRVSATLCIFMIASIANANLRKIAKDHLLSGGEYDYDYDYDTAYDEVVEYGDDEYDSENAITSN